MSRYRILPNGSVKEGHRTPLEEKDFQLFYAGVLEREAAAREARSPEFAADLRAWAAKAREKAASIDTSPPQGDLFGGTNAD
jgi:hypothetical protein